MSVPLLTDERLRSFLDGNQPQRERLCLALLSLNRRYSDITPRRPKGGPDGARDLEAILDNDVETWGAVGFLNSVSDSPNNKRSAKRKFVSDLIKAIERKSGLKSFVFFTNVDLTPTEQRGLILEAKKRGIVFVEIFYRERLRILLDSPEGLGLRFQYLSIPLSEAEQAAFFNRFGSQLEESMLKGFSAVERKLTRVEFLHDAQAPLTSLGFRLRFKDSLSLQDLEHFRISILITDPYASSNDKDLIINCRDNSAILNTTKDSLALPSWDISVYVAPKTPLFKDTLIYFDNPEREIAFTLSLKQPIFLNRLSEFNGKWVNVFLSAPLSLTS